MDEHMKKSTDLVHHHIRPFTVIQKIDDFTPMSLTANKKIIETVEEVKQMNMVFGDLIGLHLQAKIRTESRYTDMRSIMERLAVFNYNPVNMLLFPNTLAMNPAGTIQILRDQEGGSDQMIISHYGGGWVHITAWLRNHRVMKMSYVFFKINHKYLET